MPDRRRLALPSLLALGCLAAGCRDRSDAAAAAGDATVVADSGTSGSVPDDPLADLEERAFPLLVWSAYRVEQEYFDKERFDPRAQLTSAVQFLGLHTPEFFGGPNAAGDELVVTVRARTASFPLADVTTLQAAADRLEEILVFTQEVLDLDPEPLHELEYAAINGLFAPLDPHTILLSPEEHDDLGVRTRGHFGGIGAQIRAENHTIVVVRVLPGMPAEKAGMKAGDIVLTIGGAATVNMPADEAQALLRGPVGEEVVVVVRRDKTTISLPIVRETIHVESVEKSLLPGAVAYLGITTFQENTGEQVEAALRELGGGPEKGGLAGVVLDLRGNSGGLLTQATAVVDALVQRGELVIVRSALGREVEEANDTVALADGTPVVVLVDEDSASAAEIVGGGVKALGRGVVLGRSSFGKGTVQMVKPAAPYGRELALKLTVAEYLVAGDRSIQSLGVLPDLELLPVETTAIPGIARYFDEERFERQRERSRTAHLPSAKHHPSLPPDHVAPSRLRYLYADAVPEGLRALTSDVEVLERLRDPEIRIAREVALGLRGASDREDRSARLRELARRLATEEDERIVTALAKQVDWSDAPPRAGAKLEARMKRLGDGPVVAGEQFLVRVEVENKGTEAVERVHAITDCVHDELDGIEVLVGKVAPGQTVVRDLQLYVMSWHSDFSDVLALDVHVGEPDAEPDARAEVPFAVEGRPKPALAFSWWIVDDPALVAAAPPRPEVVLLEGETPFAVKGNGDGVLQPGERVLLAFAARNDGPGTSPDVRAILRNGSPQQGLLEEGALTLGQLEPGARVRGSFGITVNDTADPEQPFEVELMIGDAQVRARAGDELRLRVLPEAPALALAGGSVRVEGEPLRVYNGAHASAPVVLELPVGTEVATVGQVGSWRVLDVRGQGRRLFVPADLGVAGGKLAGKPKADPLAALEREPLVLPPGLVIDEMPLVVKDDHIRLRGTATHPRWVRDVAVLVRPPGVSQIDRKVHYAANPASQGAPAQSLKFEVDVPLEPGGNRITILVRDGRKVERTEDVWVFREKAG